MDNVFNTFLEQSSAPNPAHTNLCKFPWGISPYLITETFFKPKLMVTWSSWVLNKAKAFGIFLHIYTLRLPQESLKITKMFHSIIPCYFLCALPPFPSHHFPSHVSFSSLLTFDNCLHCDALQSPTALPFFDNLVIHSNLALVRSGLHIPRRVLRYFASGSFRLVRGCMWLPVSSRQPLYFPSSIQNFLLGWF